MKSSGTTGKKKTKKQSAKATLAEVIKEMAKPRVATSARKGDSREVISSFPDEAKHNLGFDLLVAAGAAANRLSGDEFHRSGSI